MTRRARIALTAGVLALTLVVMGAGFPAKTVPPKQWATGLCTAMGTWRTVAVDGADRLTATLSGTDTSLAETRDALAAYLEDVAGATARPPTTSRTSARRTRRTARRSSVAWSGSSGTSTRRWRSCTSGPSTSRPGTSGRHCARSGPSSAT